MRTPAKLSPEELLLEVEHWLFLNAIQGFGASGYRCRKCLSTLRAVEVRFSQHSTFWGNMCSGWGQVSMLPIPFCPNCEEPPDPVACIHLSGAPRIGQA